MPSLADVHPALPSIGGGIALARLSLRAVQVRLAPVRRIPAGEARRRHTCRLGIHQSTLASAAAIVIRAAFRRPTASLRDERARDSIKYDARPTDAGSIVRAIRVRGASADTQTCAAEAVERGALSPADHPDAIFVGHALPPWVHAGIERR